MLFFSRLYHLGVNGADVMIIRLDFLYFTFIMSAIKNWFDAKDFVVCCYNKKVSEILKNNSSVNKYV